MTASGRGLFRSAAFGFSVTAIFVAYQLLTDVQSAAITRSSALMVSFLVLCPPSILSIVMTEPEVGTNGFFVLWATIGCLNASLYAVVRLIVNARLKKSE